MNLGEKTTIGYDKGILEEATRTMPINATCSGHTQSIVRVQELQGKNAPGVHLPLSVDWVLHLHVYFLGMFLSTSWYSFTQPLFFELLLYRLCKEVLVIFALQKMGQFVLYRELFAWRKAKQT